MAKKRPKTRPESSKPGPKPETLKLEGDWQELMKQAIRKPKQPKK